MNKFNMRQWSEKMINPATYGIGRQNPTTMASTIQQHNGQMLSSFAGPPHLQHMASNLSTLGMGALPGNKLPTSPLSPGSDTTYHIFNVPFSTDLAGPDVEDILHATTDAILRWTHPKDAPNDVPIWKLPVHQAGLDRLSNIIQGLCTGPLAVDARVFTTCQERNELVSTIYLAGARELVSKSRETILNDIPHSLRCTIVDIAGNLVCDMVKNSINQQVLERLDLISEVTGTDIFLLRPKLTPIFEGISSEIVMRVEQRFRIAIYGNVDSVEHAKTRILIEIDKLLGRYVDTMVLENLGHLIACGREKKNIKAIEAATTTAIYCSPPHSPVSRYVAHNAQMRQPSEVYITAENFHNIAAAKQRLLHQTGLCRLFTKEAELEPAKIDSIMVTHIDKVRKILESNGTHLIWPFIGGQRKGIIVQGSDMTLVDNTVREILSLAGQFYNATWWIQNLDISLTSKTGDLARLLADICARSRASMLVDKSDFKLDGVDTAVKTALHLMSEIPFFVQSQYHIKVKLELAAEHKEFVSGKKNGKINKIMSQSNVQIIFDGFGEYNFYIDVLAGSYNQLKHGLDLVEAEMPASISFHVPDQFHKRIIGIGGQHIQRLMKKYSVFVKFSNALDRGGVGRDDDDAKVDNVVCRTPARNAHCLELAKNEILDMVGQADSELTTQTLRIDRLYHRELLSRMHEIELLERKWNCKCSIPASEHASDELSVKGPEWNTPRFADDLLQMVPDKHELVLVCTPELVHFLSSPVFAEIRAIVKAQHEVHLTVHQNTEERLEGGQHTLTILCTFTRNNVGSVRDTQEYLQSRFAAANLRDVSFIRGCIPRPKSNTFSESMAAFDSKILQPPVTTEPPDSPARSTFGAEEEREQQNRIDNQLTQFGRRLSSMSSLTSFLDRRKGSSHSVAPLFGASTNVSKTSLVSLESARSFTLEPNPWNNDSGVHMEDEGHYPLGRPYSKGNGATSNDLSKLSVSSIHQHGLHMSISNDACRQAAASHATIDLGRPSTSHSNGSGYPGSFALPFR